MRQALTDNVFPLVIGGDKSSVVGSVSAFQKYTKNGRLLLLDSCERKHGKKIGETAENFESIDELMRSRQFVTEKDLFLLGANFSGLPIEFVRKTAKCFSDHHCTE